MLKSLLAAAALALTTAAPVHAVPIELDFLFSDMSGTTISGTFFGLDDADGTSAASGYTYTSLGAVSASGLFTFSSRTPVPSFFLANEFAFSNGRLVFVDFVSQEIIESVEEPLHVRSAGLLIAGLRDDTSGVAQVDTIAGGPFDVTSSSVDFVIRPVAVVPLPAGAILLLTGLVGVAGLKRRTKRAA